MSVFKRISQVFQQKANAALDKVEDPTQALDLSYQKMLENLQQVRRSIADVVTSQKRLEAQKAQLSSQFDKLQGQARQALQQNQEDVARLALERARGIQGQIDALQPQIDQLKTQSAALEDTGRKLQTKIETFRTQRETMKAQYTAAKASTEAVENLSGLSEHMTDVNLMLDRAQDKINKYQARSAALGELSDSGVLDSLTLGTGGSDDIERALSAGRPGHGVDLELEQMKTELGMGAETPKEAITAPNKAAIAPTAESPVDTIYIRIAGEEIYSVPLSIKPSLDALDDEMEKTINQMDEAAFSACAANLAHLITTIGKVVPADQIVTSDLVVPSKDMTISEAKKLLELE
ncbi:MAG: PspA/IM30 family protein [Actinomycetota bacterium]|nr:PspA/IM30 family protein [Actinomycetota bacterium]